MYSLIEIGFLNAVTAAVLALPVWLFSRCCRRPAIIHALWVLVLLKLVTPPIVQFPTGLRLEHLATLRASGHWQVRANVQDGDSPPGPASARPIVVGPVSSGQPEYQQPTARTAAAAGAADEAAGLEFSRFIQRWFTLTLPLVVAIWIAGTVVWFVVQVWRMARFAIYLRAATLAPDNVQRQAQQLGAAIGVKRVPGIWIVQATMSPVLWAIGFRARVIFPAGLLDRIDEEARATLLTHELAHYHRRDHWVRLLEFAVTGLFWWHPVVWLARREIEKAEEHCCDAWVVARIPDQPRRYAEALLDTIDFLAEQRPRVVPVASGLGQGPVLRERIRLIMSGVAAHRMSGTTRMAILGVSAVLLPLGPQVFQGAIHRADAALQLSGPTSSARTTPATSGAARAELLYPNRQPEFGPIAVTRQPAAESIADEVIGDSGSGVDVWAVINSPDGRFQAIANTDGGLILRDTFQRHSFDLADYQISSIAFAPHHDLLAAGSSDSQVHLFDCPTGEVIATFGGHTAAVASVAVSLDGRYVASGCRNGLVKVWEVENESEAPHCVPRQSTPVNCVRFSPDGRLLAIAGGDWRTPEQGSVAVWDLRGKTLRHRYSTGSPVGAVAFGGDELVVAEWSGRTTSFNLRSGATVRLPAIDKDTVSAAAYAADAQTLLLRIANKSVSSAVSPKWFQRMDRDDDAQLAWSEFQGPRGVFRTLDLDHNDILTLDEVGGIY